MRFIFVSMIVLFASFVVAQPVPGPSAMVFREGGFPESIKIAAARSEKVEVNSYEARIKAAQEVVHTHELLLVALDNPSIKLEDLFIKYNNFIFSLTDAFKADDDMRSWNGTIAIKYFTWKKLGPLDVKTEQVFTQWLGVVTQSYFTPPADTAVLINRGKERLKSLILAELEKKSKKPSSKKADQQRASNTSI